MACRQLRYRPDVPRFRPDLELVAPYKPGRPISEVVAEFGLDQVAKLASNECPLPPFPEVIAAVADEASGLNRYPENDVGELRRVVAVHQGVSPSEVWMGGASSELALVAALALGGPDTRFVFAAPSFPLYRIVALIAGAEPVEVPLDADHRLDLVAMAGAVDEKTTLVFVCNPNNPTGTHRSGDDIERLIDSVPDRVMVVVDEAYDEYVTAPDHRSMISLAVTRTNVLVTRTFSKIYALAGIRIGYGVTTEANIDALRRIQLPFTVNNLAQVAALTALGQQDQVADRRRMNADARLAMSSGLKERGIEVAPTETNFVYAHFGSVAGDLTEALLRRGIIVRPVPPAGWIRISMGTEAENEMLLAALDEL